MPRKSKALRLSQAYELKAEYEAAEAQKLGPFDFICQMIGYMERDKYPSKRQRDWLDKLIEEGVPEPKGDSDIIVKMKAAVKIYDEAGKSWEANILRDFIFREGRGWSFSDKQSALRARLLDSSVDVAAGKHILQVTPEMKAELTNAVLLYNGYTLMWRNDRPALRRAVDEVYEFLNGNGKIEQYHYDKVTKGVGAKLRKLAKPRWKTGDMGFVFNRSTNLKEAAICMSDVFVTKDGKIANEWIVSGAHQVREQDSVSKR